MAHRSFDSVTRFGLLTAPPPSFRGEARGEVFADEGTLILQPDHAIAPPPPSSVRPPMSSWDDRVWSMPVGEHTNTSSRVAPKPKMSTADRSASAMLLIAAAAMLAALASVGFMHKADRQTASAAAQPITTATLAPVAVATASPVPSAAPVPPPVAAIDVDDVKTPAPAPKPAPVVVAAPKPTAQRSAEKPAEKKAAPQSAQQKKTLEDLLEQLGEEQLKR